MVGGFFPTPYPDECLYSILCRYYARIGYTTLKAVRKLLFGSQQCLTSSVFFPIRLDLVKRWYGRKSGITRKYIADKHTMHPYMTIIYPNEFRQQVGDVIKGATAPKTFDKTGTQRSRRLWPKYLRYCPDCMREDIDKYGETYWHRIHQLPAMLYCTKHKTRLYNSNVSIIGSHMDFHPASAETLYEYRIADADDSFLPYKEPLIRIGLESEWLLQHGANIDWNFDLHAKYKQFFRDKGIATVQGVSDYDLIAAAFEEYWDRDFLKCLNQELSDDREWIRQIYEAGMISFKPIYHILLMSFLCGSVKAFLEDAPHENIFGSSPWACINHLCKHNGIDGVKTVDIRYLNGVATGFFKCTSCGMVYKQRFWRKQLGKQYIVEYGELWAEQMMSCLRDEMLDIKATATILKCTPNIVSGQMKKSGIFGNPEYHRKSLTTIGSNEAKSVSRSAVSQVEQNIGNETKKMSTPKQKSLPTSKNKPRRPSMLPIYRAQVLELCNQHEEVTSDILKLHTPRAYKYLYKFDLDWLHKHMTLYSNTKRQHEEDAEMLQQVQAAVSKIYADGLPKRQITTGFIAVSSGYGFSKFYYLAEKRPLTKAFIDSVIETRTDWLRRRITDIAYECKVVGEKITIADVRRKMSLKPSTFVKYENFLKDLMDELNE